MSDELPPASDASRPSPADMAVQPGGLSQVDVLLARALSRARWNIFWERLWPPLATLLTIAGLFLAASWLGVWLLLPPLGRAVGILAFAALTGVALWPLIFLRFPEETEGLRRVDHASGVLHRPATAIIDTIATGGDDPLSAALWRAHVQRALAAARSLKAGRPSPQLANRDPVALRALVLLLVAMTFVAAGGDRFRRVAAAFNWQGVVSPPNFRLDAWVSPPAYTGRPPLILPGIRPGETAQAAELPAPNGPVSVPAGSTLVIRASGDVRVGIATTGGLAETSDGASPQMPSGADEHRFTISDNGTATIRGVGKNLAWTFAAVADAVPTIELTKEPEPQARGALQLTYKVADDYGVTEAEARFALAPDSNQGDAPRPLYGAPDAPLVLPQSRTRNGIGQTIRDLAEHPWAGANVRMTLTARDEAGNEGRSSVTEFRLPERAFAKPLARALIEQRRILALDAEARDRVLVALDGLTIAPESFIPEAGVYLGLRSIFWNLSESKTDDQLRDVVQRLWAMATQIEDGNVSEAEKELRAAQEALRQALERGAGDEEIKKLTQDLRAALDKFLQSLAEQMRRNPQQAQRVDPNARQLRAQDLKSMIDRLEQLSRSGAKDAARQLLDQLQQMLENLQTAQSGSDMNSGDDDIMAMMDELQDLTRKQQQLRDRTFQQGQDQRRQERGQQGQRGQQGDNGQMSELRQGQQGLRDRLKKLLDDMKQRGFGESQPGEQGDNGGDALGRAGDAMGDAQGALGDGNADGAVEGQGRALEALRKGAQGMAQAMQQQMGQGPGQPGRAGSGRAQETDPLGRPMRGRDYGDDVTVKVPGEVDVQRARRILEELRKRFGEVSRPQLELDYIERLLKDF